MISLSSYVQDYWDPSGSSSDLFTRKHNAKLSDYQHVECHFSLLPLDLRGYEDKIYNVGPTK